jgi:type IV pilus assembly protein PilF
MASQFSRTFMVLTLGILISACSSKRELNRKQADLYFGAGTQSLMAQNYTEALTALLKATELAPNDSDILNNLGMAYYFKGERDLAVKTIERSLEINPKNSDARVNLASIYFKEGRINDAEQLYKVVAKDLTYDKQARNLYNLGQLELQHRKNTVAAEAYFKKSIKEDDNYCPSYYQLGMIYYGRRQFNSALRNFKEASMGTCYDSPAPHYYQAVTLAEMGRFDDARMKFDDVESRFKKSVYAVKARTKALELNDMELKFKNTTQASRKMLETPDF